MKMNKVKLLSKYYDLQMMESRCLLLGLALVPDSCVLVTHGRDQNITVDSCDVEHWPFEHEFLQKCLLRKTNVSSVL